MYIWRNTHRGGSNPLSLASLCAIEAIMHSVNMSANTKKWIVTTRRVEVRSLLGRLVIHNNIKSAAITALSTESCDARLDIWVARQIVPNTNRITVTADGFVIVIAGFSI